MMQLCASKAKAPKQQQPILFPGAETMGGQRATATSDRFWRFVAMRAEVPKLRISSSFLLPITPLNAA
jgi:hypothetical protein